MPDLYQIIERPLITEKALSLSSKNQYAFVVHKNANKHQIKEAVESLFTQPNGEKLTVATVNTINLKPKVKRFRAFGRVTVGKAGGIKKAFVTLVAGQTIQIYEGV